MKAIFLILSSLVCATRVFGTYWHSAPTSANSGQSYTITSKLNAVNSRETYINLFRNGSFITMGAGANGGYGNATVSNTRSESGAQTVNWRADGYSTYYDFEGIPWTDEDSIYHSISIVSPNNAPTASLSLNKSSAVTGESVTITLTVADSDGNLDYTNLWVHTPAYGWRWIRADNSLATGGSLDRNQSATAYGTAGTFTRSFTFTTDHGTGTYTFALAAVDTQGARGDASNQTVTVTGPVSTTFTFSNLSHAYDGSVKSATVSPNPSNATYTADLTKGPSAGSYTVTATATGSFAGSGSATLVIAAPQATLSVSPQTSSLTAGQDLTFTASGGSGTGHYVWGGDASGTTSGPSKTVTFNTAGARTVTVYRAGDSTYANSNTATASITVSAPTPPSITAQPESQTVTTGSTVAFTVTATGSAPLTYQWRKDGTVISGATSSTLTLTNVQLSDAAGYSVVVSNAGGTATSSTAWLPIARQEGGGNATSPNTFDKSPVAPGIISTMVGGSGYDIATGSYYRVVNDFAVNGSVGAYPLKMTRTFTNMAKGYSFVWTLDENVESGFISNPGPANVAYRKQFLNFWSPDGQYLNILANDLQYIGWETDFAQSGDGMRIAIVRHPTTKRVESAAIHFPDGGRLLMEKCLNGSSTSKFRATKLIDPFGLVTTFIYDAADKQLPYQVTDPSGRYIRFQGADRDSITQIESSDGKWMTFSGGAVSYWDGTTASSTSGTINANTMWVRFSDVRAASPMRNVEYILQRVSYGINSNPDHPDNAPNYPVVWEVIRERHFTSNDQPDTGTLVSTRQVNARLQMIEEVGMWATGPATDVTEIRGDGATRNFTFYPSGGKMISATDFRGNRSYFRQWHSNVPGEIEDPLGRITNVEANTVGRITKITYPETAANQPRDYREYTWSARFLTGERDERGFWTYYDRDGQNRVWRIRYPGFGTAGQAGYLPASQETYVYNSLNQVEEHVFRNGASEYWEYYSTTKLPYRYWPATTGGKTLSQPYLESTYYSSGFQKDLLHTSRDPRGNVTTYEYGSAGRMTKETFQDATYRAYTYDNWGNRLTVRDELGHITTSTYDVYSRLLTVTNPLSKTTTHDYTPTAGGSSLSHVTSAVSRTTQPSGLKTAFKYDNDYRVTEEIRGETTAEEAKSIMAYDTVGNLSSRTDQVSAGVTRVTTYTYDARNRKSFEWAPLNRNTQWDYDAAGNFTKVTNPDNTFTTKTYNSMNQVATTVDEMGDTTAFVYNSAGLVHQLIDPRGKVYTNTYDAGGKLKKRQYPDATEENWDYDAIGNVDAYYSRSSHKQSYVYNNRNRETSRSWQGGLAPTVSTTYYDNGLVWTRGNGVSTITNTYYASGALHQQTQAITSGPSVTLTFGYDDDGRRQTFNAGTGRDLGYTYTARGGLHKVKNGGLNGTDLATYTYNLADQRATRTSGNGIVASYGYDGAGRLNYLNAVNVLRLDFGHDLRDRRTWTLRDQNLGDTYEYFNDSELYRYRHGVSRPDQNFNNPAQRTDTFDYDASGNRLEFNRGGTVTSYTAGDDNRYTAVSSNTIGHDTRGNVTTWDGKTFGYDADNRLVSAHVAGVTTTFAYDGDGRLVKLVKDGVTEYRFYDVAQCFLRTDGNGTALDWTVWGPTPDEVIARNVSGAWQYYHQDQINSVYAVTNASGTVLERYLYDPFGLPDVRNASWGGSGTVSAIGNPWLFTGQEWRSDLSLSNYKARWYQPVLGRFMQNDPVRFDAGDVNLYRYCGNNPVNGVDPDGLAARNPYKFSVSFEFTGRNSGSAPRRENERDNPFPAPSRNPGGFTEDSEPELSGDPFYDYAMAQPGSVEEDRALRDSMLHVFNSAFFAWYGTQMGGGSGSRGSAAPAIRTAQTVERVNPFKLVPTHALTHSRRVFMPLKADIKANGVQEPIKYVLHRGSKYIVDGHHRARAAKELGIQQVPVKRVELPFRGYRNLEDLGF